MEHQPSTGGGGELATVETMRIRLAQDAVVGLKDALDGRVVSEEELDEHLRPMDTP